MQIQNWKSMAGVAELYQQARDLGIETNIAELETFGFTVIEPEKTGVSADTSYGSYNTSTAEAAGSYVVNDKVKIGAKVYVYQ